MFRKFLTRRSISYRDASQRLRPSLDALAFLNADGAGFTQQDAIDQLHNAVHSSLEDVQKAFQLVFEQLNPEANVSDRIILDANKQIRTEQSRARNLVALRQEELNRQVRIKLENLFIQGLVQSPHQEPAVRAWENLSSRVIHRNEPSVSEYSYEDLGNPEKRGKRIITWDIETNEWLETLCQNNINEIITRMDEMIKEYKDTWVVLFPGLASFFFWIKGISIIGANRAGVFLHLMPIFGAVMAMIIFDEQFMFYHFLGAIFILSGIILSNRKKI